MRHAGLLALAAVLFCGCYRERVVVVHHRDDAPPPRVVVRVHDADSGDVWDGGVWIACPGHHHGPGCGHFFHHGFWHLHADGWVYERAGHGPAGVVEVTHVHNDHCGHCWDGEHWVLLAGHVHGPGCGHFWHHGAWHLHPDTFVYTRPGCGHFGVRVVVHRR